MGHHNYWCVYCVTNNNNGYVVIKMECPWKCVTFYQTDNFHITHFIEPLHVKGARHLFHRLPKY